MTYRQKVDAISRSIAFRKELDRINATHDAKLATFAGRRAETIETIAFEMDRDGMSAFAFADVTAAFRAFVTRMDHHGFDVTDDFETFAAFNDDLVTAYREMAA